MRNWVTTPAVTACLVFTSFAGLLGASNSKNFYSKSEIVNKTTSQTYHNSQKHGKAVTFINTLHLFDNPNEGNKAENNLNITMKINRQLVNHDPKFAEMVFKEAISELKKRVPNGNKIYAISVIKNDKRTIIQTDIALDEKTNKQILTAKNKKASPSTSKPNIQKHIIAPETKLQANITEATTEKNIRSKQSSSQVNNQTLIQDTTMSTSMLPVTSKDKVTLQINNTTAQDESKGITKQNSKTNTTSPFHNQTSNREARNEINTSTVRTTNAPKEIRYTTTSSTYEAQRIQAKVLESDHARNIADAIRLKNDQASEIKGKKNNLDLDRAWRIVAAIQNREARLESSGVPPQLARKLALDMYEIPVIPGRGPLISL